MGDESLIERIHSNNLTYLTEARLASIAACCRAIERAHSPGIFLEAGCALGGSAILIASLKRPERPLFVYDVFGMIPAPTVEDTPEVHERYRTIAEGKSPGLGEDQYYGYQDDLYEVVKGNFKKFGIDTYRHSISLIKGYLQEIMIIEQPVAFAHIDVDWYDPVMTCLQRIFPNLVSGGSIVVDDYHDWGGCKKATDEFLLTVPERFILDDSAGSLKITKRY
jgi:macrocin-O-methyltransferase TylF-like protien